MSRWLRELVLGQRVMVTLGSGGVGKTTLAAALALQAALWGRRALVLTIDPARRLAEALGLSELTAERQRVPLEGLLPSTKEGRRGELWAMMLDAPRTFDALVARHATSAEARDRILQHRLYRHMVDALAGSHDLAALEQLYELVEEGGYDLVVLDTPPKEHAFDFLEAPSRFLGVVTQSKLRWLLLPMAGLRDSGAQERGGLRSFGPRLILRTLSRFTGADVLKDLATLTLALLDLSKGFGPRANRVERLLTADDSSFLVVSRPDPLTVVESLGQQEKIEASGLPFSGFLVNRCLRIPPAAPDARAEPEDVLEPMLQQPGLDEIVPLERLRPLLYRLHQGLRLLQVHVEHEKANISRLVKAAGGAERVLEIPELDDEIHSVEQLLRFGRILLEGVA